MVATEDRAAELQRRCSRFLLLHGRRTIADELAELIDYAGDREPERYGTGALIEELEERVATLAGTEAAVFLPSGVMAQQIALRIWADETGVDTVALHALSHLEVHELGAVWELHRLRPRFLSREPRQPTVHDLNEIAGPIGAIALELPLRRAGYTLPSWQELTALCASAKERGVRIHLDGARLWESTVYLERSVDEIVGLADSVYLSFYKILGGISGAALVGAKAFIGIAREWQQRHGGRLVTQYPAVLSALRGLDERLPRVPAYVEHARGLAERLSAAPEMRVFPRPPHCNGFLVFAEADPEALRDATLAYAEEHRVWTTRWYPAEVPGWSVSECVVGEATMGWTIDEIADLYGELITRAVRRVA